MCVQYRKLIFDWSLSHCTDNYNRVHLRYSPGVDGSDYINASYIDVSTGMATFHPYKL